jgi:hypothetical protein
MRRLVRMAVLCGVLWSMNGCAGNEVDTGSLAPAEEEAAEPRSLTVEADYDYFSDDSFTTEIGAKWRLCGGLQGHSGDTSGKNYIKTLMLCAPPYTTTIRCYANNHLVACP